MIAKIFMGFLMIAILFSLIRGGLYLIKDNSKSENTLSSLKWRIALSISLFIFLFIAFAMGYIRPHSL